MLPKVTLHYTVQNSELNVSSPSRHFTVHPQITKLNDCGGAVAGQEEEPGLRI